MSSNHFAKELVGMIHLAALPGTPKSALSVREIVRQAVADAKVYREAGFTAILLENMHDTPYLARTAGPEIVAAVTMAAQAVREAFSGRLGLQILAGANEQAIAVAHAAELDFIRAEGFCFAHVADEGWLDACAGPLLRFRKMLGADRVEIWADIKKKHSAHAVTSDVSLLETATAAEFMRADRVIVTGKATGKAPPMNDFDGLREAARLPVVIGSGVSLENLAAFWPLADAFIVGSSLKAGRHWSGPLDATAVQHLADLARSLGS